MDNLETKNDQKIKALIALVAVLLVIILLFVGKYMFPDTDAAIKEIVRGVNDTFTQISDPDIIDARCYRDGSEKGVVLEYTFSKRLSSIEVDRVKVKKNLIAELKKQSLERIITFGVYFKVVYKNYKSRDIFEVKITAEDLSK